MLKCLHGNCAAMHLHVWQKTFYCCKHCCNGMHESLHSAACICLSQQVAPGCCCGCVARMSKTPLLGLLVLLYNSYHIWLRNQRVAAGQHQPYCIACAGTGLCCSVVNTTVLLHGHSKEIPMAVGNFVLLIFQLKRIRGRGTAWECAGHHR